MDYSNIPLGLKITTQIPLDVKTYIQNEAALKDLGLSDNLAFTYVQGCTFYCIQEGTRYEWREVVGGEIGLRTTNYTYPNGIVAFGITYSNKVYNFFPTTVTSQVKSDWNATSGVSEILNKPTIILPPFQAIDEGSGVGFIIRGRNPLNFGPIGLDSVDFSTSTGISTIRGTTGTNSISIGDDVITSGFASGTIGSLINNSSEYGFATGVNLTSAGQIVSLLGVGHNVTGQIVTVVGQAANTIVGSLLTNNESTKAIFVVGNGVITDNDDTYPVFSRSDALIVRMNGVATLPSVTNALITSESTGKAVVTREYLESKIPTNLQKIITASYVLTSADNNYTIIINNGTTPINITIPTGLLVNIFVGFIQKGTADVTFVASGTTIYNPTGLKSKGQYYNTSIDQEGTTNTFYLLGNTKV
jgi:hypothetical protein